MEYDVIIVGAGICGLTTAIELAAKGKSLLILEAEDEAGGRAKSIALPEGTNFNLGANWFHGGDANPFFQWAKARYDLGPLNEDKPDIKRLALKGDQDVTDLFQENLAAISQTYEEFKRRGEHDASMADLANALGTEDARALAEFWSVLWMAGDNAQSIAARDFFEDPLGAGGWQMQNGLSHLITQMADDARNLGAQIELNKTVIAVKKEDDAGVRVMTRQGDLYTARKALVTTSIGVLKSGLIAFDDDVTALLDQKLSGLSMGHFFKACLPVRPDYFEGRNIPENFSICVIGSDKPCFIHARTAGKPTVTVFTGGALCREMELWDTDDIERFAFDALEKTGRFEGVRQAATGIIVPTFWSNHPHYLGAYVVSAPHAKKCDPIEAGNIVFAGEALLASPLESPGQMAGAWGAGRKAAHLMLHK